MSQKISWFGKTSLGIGFFFLYAPIVILMIYSFNASKLVTVWGGFSTHWYGELFRDEAVMSALGLSLKVALLSSVMAVALGTIAGMVLARFGRFRSKSLCILSAAKNFQAPGLTSSWPARSASAFA